MRAEDVVEDGATDTAVDLLMDARARILDALAHDYRSVDALLEGSEGDVVLITETLTPSVVASLPSRVVGIVASSGDSGEKSGSTAHSVILAREREIALALVSTEDLSDIQKNDLVVVDTTEDAAVVSVGPGDEVTQAALAKRHAWNQARDAEAAEAAEPLRQLGVSVLVNVGSVHDRVPASAEGIGLVRTELVFSDHSNAPSEAEQFGVVCAIAALSRRSRAVVRLFDAGGDKPLRWLAPPPGAEAARGIELLGHHPRVLEAQLRAIVRVAHHFDVAVLVPYVRSPRDVADVRARTRGRVPVGALIETTEAVEQIAGIIAASDFVSIGTNDLAASVTGTGRANVGLSLDARLLRMIRASRRGVSRSVVHSHGMRGDRGQPPRCARRHGPRRARRQRFATEGLAHQALAPRGLDRGLSRDRASGNENPVMRRRAAAPLKSLCNEDASGENGARCKLPHKRATSTLVWPRACARARSGGWHAR